MDKKYCLTCFKEINLTPIRDFLENNPLICSNCLSQIPIKLIKRKIFNTSILFLSEYESVMKSYLMNYKEYKDVELAKVFLKPFLNIIKLLYKNYLFIPCPSSKMRVENRGIDHLEEILKVNKINYELVLTKNSNEIHKNLKMTDRFNQDTISIIDSKKGSLKNKKIVLFDDVFTTGNTFKQSLEVLKKENPSIIKGLIILDNYKIDELKIK